MQEETLRGGGGVPTRGAGLVRCPVGAAVATDAVGDEELTSKFDTIIHAVPPLWTGVGGSQLDPEVARLLLHDSFDAAIHAGLAAGCHVLTIPLLGAGSRGAPVPVAIEAAAAAAAAAAVASASRDAETFSLELVVLEPAVAADLVAAIDARILTAAAG